MTKEKILYDVCNDYSLEVCEDQKKDLREYRTKPHAKGTLYIHKEYGELHYLLGEEGLERKS